MSFGDAGQNLAIGLHDGLELGLAISLLLAVAQRVEAAIGAGTRRGPRAWPIGLLVAITSAGSAAAVVTYSSGLLPPTGRHVAVGLIGVIAAPFVVAQLVRLQRSARLLSLVALLLFGRGALDTMSSVWPAVRAADSTSAPLIGLLAGLLVASGLCWLVHRQVRRLDLATAVRVGGTAVIVILAGVLADAVGRFQAVGWLPGGQATAFDVRSQIDPGSWAVALLSGASQLAPRMSLAQVGTWTLVVLVGAPLWIAAARALPKTPQTSRADRVARDVRRPARRRVSAGAATLAPCAAAGLLIVALPATAGTTTTAVSVTDKACASEWTAGHTGTQTFQVNDKNTNAGEIDLVNSSGGVVSWIEVIGPGTTVPMIATLGPGQYQFVCHMYGGKTIDGATVQVTGAPRNVPLAVRRVTLDEMAQANRGYISYASNQLSTLSNDVSTLHDAVAGGDLTAAKAAWLTAQLDWEKVGASYNSFGEAGIAVDGLPAGLPDGVDDPDFTGLHRIEYGLYHGQSSATLLPIVNQLASDVATVRKNLSQNSEGGDPTVLSLRVHEVLEDALRDHLTGLDDEGSGMGYAETYADAQVTRTLVGFVKPLLDQRKPSYVDTINTQLDRLQNALAATKAGGAWQSPTAVTLAARQRVNAALGAVLETLSSEPELLLVPPNHCVRDPTNQPHHNSGDRSSMSTPTATPTATPTTTPADTPTPTSGATAAPSQIPFCQP